MGLFSKKKSRELSSGALLQQSVKLMTADECMVVNVMKDEYDVYIGRTNKWKGLEGSIFRNRFRMKNKSMEERMRVIEEYRKWFYKMLEEEWFREEVEKLRGKRLGCWCAPLPCHGDVIVEYLKGKVEIEDCKECHGEE